jgi:hypothetical protein
LIIPPYGGLKSLKRRSLFGWVGMGNKRTVKTGGVGLINNL